MKQIDDGGPAIGKFPIWFKDAHFQSRDHTVECLGWMTGHSVEPIAYCKSKMHAEMIVETLKAIQASLRAISQR